MTSPGKEMSEDGRLREVRATKPGSGWRHYAENRLAPLCRKRNGSISAKIHRRLGLLFADALQEIDWLWLALDGAMTKAPLVRQHAQLDTHRCRHALNPDRDAAVKILGDSTNKQPLAA